MCPLINRDFKKGGRIFYSLMGFISLLNSHKSIKEKAVFVRKKYDSRIYLIIFLIKEWQEGLNTGHRVSNTLIASFYTKEIHSDSNPLSLYMKFFPDITNTYNHFLTHIIYMLDYHQLLEGIKFRGLEYKLCIPTAILLNKFRQVTSPLFLIFLICKNGTIPYFIH